jgi:hypothetical protein
VRFSLPVLVGALASGAAVLALATAATAADECRPAYITPYAQQCDFDYHGIRKDQSVENVGRAYDACARAQAVAVVCVKSPDRKTHLVAEAALYRDVTEQAEIATFAGQFSLAEALLREKGDVLRVVAGDRPKNDPAVAHERRSIAADLEDAKAGACTSIALLNAQSQSDLARAHKYDDLAKLLFVKAQAFVACAPLATTKDKSAYIKYEALVALEESGRASQATGDQTMANDRYTACLDDTKDASIDASPTVKKYLTIVHSLCKARMLGKYPVDKPEPLDQPSKDFHPLTMPN